ncbi:hypothetical protein MXB_4069 [Myxobolus squamalis]|nr:hypothetical protein MXB_4069 [Myxobolus squamalis]
MVSEAELNLIEIYEDLNENLEKFNESCDDLFKIKNTSDLDSNRIKEAMARHKDVEETLKRGGDSKSGTH